MSERTSENRYGKGGGWMSGLASLFLLEQKHVTDFALRQLRLVKEKLVPFAVGRNEKSAPRVNARSG